MSRHLRCRESRAGIVLAFALCALVVAGCSTSDSSGPADTGSLLVTIIGVEGMTPSVAVEGPGGYQQTITATGTLSGLVPGSYTVAGRSVIGSSSIFPVAYTATVTGSPVTVNAGDTATASVSYAPAEPAMLWVGTAASDGPRLLGYTASELETSTSAPPAIALTPPPGTGAVTGMAFDQDGNLWVADSANSTVSKYTAAQLASSGSVTPAVVLSSTDLYSPIYGLMTGPSIMGPHGLAFDASGNLWVANGNPDYYGQSSIAEFAPSQLVTSGALVPLYMVFGDYCSYRCRFFHSPQTLLFDPTGNLWVSDLTTEKVLIYPPDQLKPQPGLGFSFDSLSIWDDTGQGEAGTDSGLDSPIGLAFDAAGDLWVSLGLINRLVDFAPSQQVNGPAVPTLTLGGVATSLSGPRGLAFDSSGNLWVANLGGNAILEFTASQLGSSGDPVPNVVIETTSPPAVLAFNPRVALNFAESSR
jgi:sugar lactone lactonase YvrE